MENRKEFLLSKKKMEQKSRGDKRSFVFKKTILSNEILFKKTFEQQKTQEADDRHFS